MKLNRILILGISGLTLIGLVACGGGGDSDKSAAVTPVGSKVAVSSPTPTEVPPTPTPTEVPPTPTPTEVPPTPTPTEVPPTRTGTPPESTPTPVIAHTTIDTFGFALTVDGEVDVESSGLTEELANSNDGILSFEYAESDVFLIWFAEQNINLDNVLADTYTLFADEGVDSTLMSEGDSIVDTQPSKYLTFVTKDDSGESQGGGVIGSWQCPSGSVFSLAVTASDPTTLQVRFKRLLDNFTCGQ